MVKSVRKGMKNEMSRSQTDCPKNTVDDVCMYSNLMVVPGD